MHAPQQSSDLGIPASVPTPPGLARRTRQALVDLLFPPRCVICRQAGSAFCPECLGRVRLLQEEIGFGGTADGTALRGIRSAGVYQPPLNLAIRAFKYRGRTDLAASLGGLLARAWPGCSIGVDFVAAVPLHENRLRERGYNQAELLAIELCRAASLPLAHAGLLARHKDTEHQVVLGLDERRHNVQDAFIWRGPALGGAAALLIDDVATTGSTLEACAEALAQAGAGAVWALTVARAMGGADKSALPADASRRRKEG